MHYLCVRVCMYVCVVLNAIREPSNGATSMLQFFFNVYVV